MSEVKLGKIVSAEFGYGGYQDVQFGLSFTFEGVGWGVGTFIGEWNTGIKVTEFTKWTEEYRSERFDFVVREANRILKQAKKQYVSQLKGVPVEVTFDSMTLESWRILEEVL